MRYDWATLLAEPSLVEARDLEARKHGGGRHDLAHGYHPGSAHPHHEQGETASGKQRAGSARATLRGQLESLEEHGWLQDSFRPR